MPKQKRSKMARVQRYVLFAALALCRNGVESISSSGPAPRVIVFSLADDYGYNNVGFAHGPLNKGNPEMRTPTLDRLAGDGVILERHYVCKYELLLRVPLKFDTMRCLQTNSALPLEPRFYRVVCRRM